MKAMILAAGEGTRMRHLTTHTPKPLLTINGQSLLDRLLCQLYQAGISEAIINVRYLADQFYTIKPKPNRPTVIISDERIHQDKLNTGGGIIAARHLLGQEPCLIISGDIYTDFPFASLTQKNTKSGHLILIPNPPFNPQGDFNLKTGGLIESKQQTPYTYGNIGLFSPELFNRPLQNIGLGQLLKEWASANQLTGELFHGFWDNVGTPEQLKAHQAQVIHA